MYYNNRTVVHSGVTNNGGPREKELQMTTSTKSQSGEATTKSNSTTATPSDTAPEVSEATHVTAYQISKTVNAALQEAGLPTKPSQMFYNYLRNGLINKGVKGPGQSVTTATAQEFITGFLAKRLNQPEQVSDTVTEGVEQDA